MDKNKPVIMLTIAVIIALFVTFLSYRWLKREPTRVEVKAVETSQAAVASIDLSWGTTLTREMFKIVPFLKESLPPGAFSDPAALEGRTLIYPVKAAEPIFESQLAPTDVKTGGVAAVITPTKRAMAVKVDKVIGISGFIFPGHRVDVLVTIRKREGNKTETITKTVLENILVLAVGPRMEQSDKQEKTTDVDVITLEVTPEEGEKLALAAVEGKLQLALRNFADTGDIPTLGMTVPTLLTSYQGYKEAKEKKEVKKWIPRIPGKRVVKQKPVLVELIKGNTVSKLKF